MNRPVAGAFAPVPTPLDVAGEVDTEALGRHLLWLAGEGLDGALVLGTNGEFPSLTLDERVATAEAAAASGADLDLLLGVGSCALPEARRLAVLAGRLGYRAVLCPPPFYFRTATVEGIAAFFRGVMEVCELPLLLYHIPSLTGVEVSDEVVAELAGDARLAGVKDSTGSVSEMDRLLVHFGGGSYMVGHDRLITRCLRSGGAGSISAAANVAPALVAAVHADASRQPALDEVRGLLDAFGLGPAAKALLARQGVGAYASRAPVRGLSAARRDALFEAWDRLAAVRS